VGIRTVPSADFSRLDHFRPEPTVPAPTVQRRPIEVAVRAASIEFQRCPDRDPDAFAETGLSVGFGVHCYQPRGFHPPSPHFRPKRGGHKLLRIERINGQVFVCEPPTATFAVILDSMIRRVFDDNVRIR